VVFAGEGTEGLDGLMVGDAAQRRGLTEPQGVAREFKRRIGDPTPIVLRDASYTAEALMARVLRAVIDQVATQQGGPAAGITVSHPANWGAYKKALLLAAIADAGVGDIGTVTEPEAAAIHYASQERVEAGTVVAVYDLGGGTFDAALLRKTVTGWEIAGQPEGIERLGGIDFDEAVFRHVVAATNGAFDELDEDDPAVLAAVGRLRRDCVDAKEALSADSLAGIPVLLPPAFQADVRLTRSEFETLIRPPLKDSVEALRRALRTAAMEADGISRVLLVGGSSRIPLVAEIVASDLGCPVAVDAHPKYAVALGSAILAAERGTSDALHTREVVIPVEPPGPKIIIGAPMFPHLVDDPGPEPPTESPAKPDTAEPEAAPDDESEAESTLESDDAKPQPEDIVGETTGPVIPDAPVFPQLVQQPIPDPEEEGKSTKATVRSVAASPSLPTQASAAARPAPPLPRSSLLPPEAEPDAAAERPGRQVYVPAPEVVARPTGPRTPPQPQILRPAPPRPRGSSGGRPAVSPKKRRRRRAYRMARLVAALIVLSSLAVIAVLLAQAVAKT
jgi:Ethanolamine utilization protein EutJ (predicted chaperonin)